MGKGKNIHVVKHKDGWAVKEAGNSEPPKVFETQAKAIKKAKEIAKSRGVDTKIHGEDGKIRDGDSYGNDPFPPRDKK